MEKKKNEMTKMGYVYPLVNNQTFKTVIFKYMFFLFVCLLYVPSQQLWSLRDGQFT